MIKNIFFDFDGVLVDSVNIKTKAFKNLYKKYGKETVQKVETHHKNNGGMSRYEKFKYYHKNFIGKEITEQEVNDLSEKFSKYVINEVINAKEVKGVRNFLKENHNKYNMFIISATPTEELKFICKKRKIVSFLKEICGSPKDKIYWTKYLLEKHNLKREETIFVGDAMADFNAATETKLKFFLREYHENIQLFSSIKDVSKFNDFNDFRKLMNELHKKNTVI